jgi:hypothetical protein
MGPTAKVFLKTEVTDELAIRVDAEVRSIASEVSPTRKGRNWEIGIDSDGEGGSRPFHVHLWDTRDQLWDCEDQLMALKLSASDLPAHIAFSAGINQPEDHMLLERITKVVANAMDGIPTEPSK